MSNIAVVGSGYVGLVAGTMFADCGHSVICCDVDKSKVDMLTQGKSPIYEEGLEDLLKNNLEKGTLTFTTDIPLAIKSSEVIFIAVGTPPLPDGHADLSYVYNVAHEIGKHMDGNTIVVDKSTVPVGTAKAVAQIVKEELDARGASHRFEVVSNPEFLREGTSVADFKYPDRVVLGCRTEKACNVMSDVYRQLVGNDVPILKVKPETAEMIKYASNAYLAVKIAYINELACLCEKTGADIEEVAYGMGLDSRISPKFMEAGPGYGGSCFPKDTNAICNTASLHGMELRIIKAAIRANEKQKLHMAKKISRAMGSLQGKTISVLGITFKPGTDDMRDAPSLVIIPELIKLGATIKIYDPQCQKEAKWRFQDVWESITLHQSEYEAVEGADAVVLLTQWPQFANLDFSTVKNTMNGNYFFDLRNMFQKEQITPHGFEYHCVGKV